MKWGDKYRRTELRGWQSWFAWYPVWLNDVGCWVWLEWVQRRGIVQGPGWGEAWIEYEHQQVRPARKWP